MSGESGDGGKVAHDRARTKRACPICDKPAVAESWPFCSKRCADVDLGRWFSGRYRIPTDEAPEAGEAPPDEEG